MTDDHSITGFISGDRHLSSEAMGQRVLRVAGGLSPGAIAPRGVLDKLPRENSGEVSERQVRERARSSRRTFDPTQPQDIR